LEKIKTTFGPMRDRYFDLIKKPNDLREIILQGSARARLIAKEKLEALQDAVGLIGRPF
jgi:hypothetical protein